MSRLSLLVAICIAGLVLVPGAGGAPEARLSVTPRIPHTLERVRVELVTLSAGLRVKAVSPRGHVLPIRMTKVRPNRRRGTFHFPIPGRWLLRVTDVVGRPLSGVYPLRVRVLDPLPTPAPAGFGPLGQPGCDPPSPADASTEGLRDIFGTTIGGEQLWALPFLPRGATWAGPDAAIFDGLVGKEVKIVFATTSGYGAPFRAVGLDGTAITPVWGPSSHLGSNWGKSGAEFGAGFVFPDPGCWGIEVGPHRNVWLLLRS